MKRLNPIILIVVVVVCFGCTNKDIKTLNDKRMFNKSINRYLNKPIKYLILDSKSKLKTFSFADDSAPFYLDGITLTYFNDVKIFVGINEFKFESFRKAGKLWDINKLILENASSIELISDKKSNYVPLRNNIRIEFISYDSIRIEDTVVEGVLKKKKLLSE